jgi:hypothetical protein
MVHPYELAGGSALFRRLDLGPQLRTIARFRIIREEPWERSA